MNTFDELRTRARLFRHRPTGAQLLSLENDDENKVFGITFRTPPADSTGIAHILEHAVLGGSEKYPLKEPFVQLLKGSLKTFLNAMTYPDRTVYPVASQNLQDFYNLVDVYLDAVFHPLITPYHLQQEGWHYELESLDAPLTYKGVVFNEMKGAYSSPDSLLYRYSQQSLFPDTPYGRDSGGDPRVIPELTYQAFREFHRRYYHPSNAFIYFYGDDDPEARLRIIGEALQGYGRAEVQAEVPLQPPFPGPRRLVQPFGVAAEEQAPKGLVQLNWLLPENTDPTLTMGLSVLSYALVSTQASPLRKALIDSGLGEDVTGGGLSTTLRQMTFRVGMRGVDPANMDKVEALILDTLQQLARDGFEEEMVEAAYNSIEFSLRENNTGAYPRGLSLMMRAHSTWLYGGDPLATLAFERPLRAVRQALDSDPEYLQRLLRTYLVENAHRTTVILQPDPELNRRLEEEERARLAAIRQQMSQQELEAVMENARELKRRQETPDDPEALARLPTLTLADLDPKIKTIPLAQSEVHGRPLLFHDLFTNGILYLSVGFDLHGLPQELLPYAKLFGQALVEMGTHREDFVKLSQRIDRTTGGISPGLFLSAQRERPGSQAWLFLHGKAVVDRVPEMLAIFHDVLTDVRLDNQERFRQIVLKDKARMESALIPSGHSVVYGRLQAGFNEAAWISEQMGGISHLFFLRELATAVDQDWPSVLEKLEEVRRLLVNRNLALVNVTLDADNWSRLESHLAEFLAGLPAAASIPARWSADLPAGDEGLAIPAQVNYVGKGADLYRLGYRLHGSILAITNFLRTVYLWDRVRVQGGAYGGFCRFGQQSGVFGFLSYRDPNLLNTLDVYDQAATFLRELALSPDELTRSIIGAIGALDAYQLPDAKGYTSMVRYLVGETDEHRQQIRDELLSTRPAHFQEFADVLAQVSAQGRVVVMGAREALEQANSAWGNRLQVQKVL
ncbi:MAG: peptidase M16 [Litorilinea sp.]|nr:MAG: peptidase M16 [Litorilinea sp.]